MMDRYYTFSQETVVIDISHKGENIMKWYVCECEDNNIPFIVKEFDNREEAVKFLDDYLEFREKLYRESTSDLALSGNWYRVLNDDDLDDMDY